MESQKFKGLRKGKEIFFKYLSLYFLLLHTILWYLGLYSNKLFSCMIAMSLWNSPLYLLEQTKPLLAHSIKACIIGAFPAVLMTVVPKYCFLSIIVHFLSISVGSNELKLQKMRVLLISNITAWFLCFLYYQFHTLDEDEAKEINYFLRNPHSITQMVIAGVINYFLIFPIYQNKLTEVETHKQYESTLLSLNKELEETNSKLTTMNRELQEALQEKENFILRFSHEIRNPLNCLLGNVELCDEYTNDTELKVMLQDAKVSGEILLQLLNNILDSAKVSAGRLEISRNYFKIRDFLERAWVICSEIIRKKGLYGCLSANINMPEVLEFDSHRIMQILINTISNATKFTEHGNVKVYVDFEEGSVIRAEDMKPKHASLSEVSCLITNSEVIHQEELDENPRNKYEYLTISNKRFTLDRKKFLSKYKDTREIPSLERGLLLASKTNDMEICSNKEQMSLDSSINNDKVPTSQEGYIRFEIIDTGCGMAKKDLETIFDKFKQVHSDPSKRQIGTGLGLWITKEIIELMEGKIKVYSVQGKGTVIVIMLKSKASTVVEIPSKIAISPDKTETVSRNSKASPKRVLVVEDMPYNQEINRRFLEKCGIKDITMTSNGEEAVDVFKRMGEQYFDLILMDIDMPILDGKEATKIMRHWEKENGWSSTTIVFLTAFAEAKTQLELLDPDGEYRADEFISKPASLEAIANVLKGIKSSKQHISTEPTTMTHSRDNLV